MKENRISNDYIPFRQLRVVGLMQRLADVLDKSDCEILDYYVTHGLSVESIYKTLKCTIELYETFMNKSSLEGESSHKIGKDYIKERLEYINNVLREMKGVNLDNALTIDDLREFLKKPDVFEEYEQYRKYCNDQMIKCSENIKKVQKILKDFESGVIESVESLENRLNDFIENKNKEEKQK